jgi:hypothetical protein
MNKQGNWWLHALVQYDHHGEVLLMHRVTGEISIKQGTPTVSTLHNAAKRARCLVTGMQCSIAARPGARRRQVQYVSGGLHCSDCLIGRLRQ